MLFLQSNYACIAIRVQFPAVKILHQIWASPRIVWRSVTCQRPIFFGAPTRTITLYAQCYDQTRSHITKSKTHTAQTAQSSVSTIYNIYSVRVEMNLPPPDHLLCAVCGLVWRGTQRYQDYPFGRIHIYIVYIYKYANNREANLTRSRCESTDTLFNGPHKRHYIHTACRFSVCIRLCVCVCVSRCIWDRAWLYAWQRKAGYQFWNETTPFLVSLGCWSLGRNSFWY